MIRIESKNVVLEELTDLHLTTLCQWRNEDDFMKNCSMRKNLVSFEEFAQELYSDFEKDRHVQFVIFRRRDMKPIGTIYSYSYSKRDAYCFITTYITSLFEDRGYGAESFANFMGYLFDMFGLFKIYNDVYDFNTDSLKMLQKAGFKIEGVFRGHRLFDGQRHDLIRLAFFAEQKVKLVNFLTRLKFSKGGEDDGNAL